MHVLAESLRQNGFNKDLARLEADITFFRNPVLPAQLLPELEANLVTALPQLEHDHLTRHDVSTLGEFL